MRRSYESPLPLQEGWSSLQTHSRARRDTHRGLALVSGRLGNLHARTALRACSKNLQIAPNCGSWVSSHNRLATGHVLGVPAKGHAAGASSGEEARHGTMPAGAERMN